MSSVVRARLIHWPAAPVSREGAFAAAPGRFLQAGDGGRAGAGGRAGGQAGERMSGRADRQAGAQADELSGPAAGRVRAGGWLGDVGRASYGELPGRRWRKSGQNGGRKGGL